MFHFRAGPDTPSEVINRPSPLRSHRILTDIIYRRVRQLRRQAANLLPIQVIGSGYRPQISATQITRSTSSHSRTRTPQQYHTRPGLSGDSSTVPLSRLEVTPWTFDFPGSINNNEVKEEALRLAQIASNLFQDPMNNSRPVVQQSSAVIPATSQELVSGSSSDSTLVAVERTVVIPPPICSRTCCLCTEKFEGSEDIVRNFPWKCETCTHSTYCIGCIKDWFLDACKNESKMPPKCCYAIPLAIVVGQLDVSQINLFKAKHEEWNTADRLYCPVPSCSAFIPPRLFLGPGHLGAPPSSPPPEVEQQGEAEGSVSKVVGPPGSIVTKAKVACPECHSLICTSCHSLTHDGNCPQTDLDPELALTLERWKIKRCPKCRTGLRKMYGCNHVECHCGAHFCYACMRPFLECDGECADDDEDDVDDIDEDDLDGRDQWYDGDGREIGEEPATDRADIWGCLHNWRPVYPATVEVDRHVECHRCFAAVDLGKVKPTSEVDGAANVDGEDTVMDGTSTTELPGLQTINHLSQLAVISLWDCRCGRVLCNVCKEIEEN